MGKNDGTPVNLLALDGGGIRGICELRVLDEIMKRVQKAQNLTSMPRPCDYFHLMAGTSTGGLVAILLSRFKMTTTDAIAAYYDFSGKIFHKKNKKGIIGHSFGEAVLEGIIKEMVASHQVGELMLDPKPSARSKAFVCSQEAHHQGMATRFRTYELPTPERDVSPYTPSRAGSSSSSSIPLSPSPPAVPSSSAQSSSSSSSIDEPRVEGSPRLGRPESTVRVEDEPWGNYRDIQIWEAARATTAAPSFFEPMILTRGKHTKAFIDGALGCNNPASELVDEATALFGADCVLGCLVSLGTGSSGEMTIGNRKGLYKIVDLLMNLKKIATDTENVHQHLLKLIRPELDTYFRFQLPSGAERIGLHEYKKLDELSELMRVYIEQESPNIDKVVQILIGKTTPQGVKLGQISPSDHGHICPPKKDIRSRPPVSEFFTGRKDTLDTLAEFFRPDPQKPNRKRHHLLYGQPGAGKSQTASKFLDDYGHWFDMILWVDAMSKETLEAGFKELDCSEYGYVGEGSPNMLLRWLETTEKSWILVFDDVREDISEYVPRGNKGAVLFTSQNKLMKPAQRSATLLDVMSEEDALELLISSARLDDEGDGKMRQHAVELTKNLGYLPLAIEMAAATLRMEQWKVSEYATKLKGHRDDLLKKSGSEGGSFVLQAVHASFDVTYKVLNTQAHGGTNGSNAEAAKYALQLLSLFSFYHNEGLMGNLLKRAVEHRPDDRREDDYGVGAESFADLLATDESGKWLENRWRLGMDVLISYSLVKSTKDNQVQKLYSIHGLVHAWARERLPEYLRRVRAKAARLVLFDSITESQSTPDDFLYGFKVLPHARAMMMNAESIDPNDQALKGIHMYRYGLLSETAGLSGVFNNDLLQAALIFRDQDGVFSERFHTVAGSLIEAGRRRGHLKDSFNLAMVLYGARVKSHGKGDLYTLRALVRATALAIDVGEFELTEGILRNCLLVFDLLYPDEEQLITKTALAITLFNNERVKEARDLLFETVIEATRKYGTSHPRTLESISNLAIAEIAEENFEEAEKMFQYVIDMENSLFGPYHMGRAYSLHNLATAYFYQDRFEEALELFKRARRLAASLSITYKDIRYLYHFYGIAMSLYHLGNRELAIRRIGLCCKAFNGMMSEGHIYAAAAEQQREAWIREEEKDLPIRRICLSSVIPIFRY